MNDDTPGQVPAEPGMREVYTHGADPAAEAVFARRNGAVEADFFLPYLRSGMWLLDCGSGPGTITVDLAAVVAPGQVVGLDVQQSQVERARSYAIARGVGNVRFEVGSIYALPFPDATFDAAFAHQVLLHLRHPLAALRELQRVLKPGGIVGIRDVDFGLWHITPPTPLLETMQALLLRVYQHNGGSPFYARHQRSLLLAAGFGRGETSASFLQQGAGTPSKIQQAAALTRALLGSTAFTETALGEGWAEQADLDAMNTELRAWSERPDACFAVAQYASVGWVDA